MINLSAGLRTKKGIALYIVLTTILIVTVLANIVIRMMLTHARVSRHELSRTQAYYAGLAAMNWARAQLEVGNFFCNPAINTNSCRAPAGCVFNDPALPNTIRSVRVIFCPAGQNCLGGTNLPCNPQTGSTFCIHVVTDYTYVPQAVP